MKRHEDVKGKSRRNKQCKDRSSEGLTGAGESTPWGTHSRDWQVGAAFWPKFLFNGSLQQAALVSPYHGGLLLQELEVIQRPVQMLQCFL